MNESLLLQFEAGGRPLKIQRFRAEEGIVFERDPGASPLNAAIGLRPVYPELLALVQRRHDWRRGEFRLDVAIDSGGLRFSGYKGDPEGLPDGIYDLTVQVESYEFRDGEQRVSLGEGQKAVVTLHEKPDLRRVQLHDNFDHLTAAVINNPQSKVDGQPLLEWLKNPLPRAARQACLLNVLCKLRVPPDPTHGLREPLTEAIGSIYFADVDRVYAAAKPELADRLDRLVEAKLWVKEGHPAAAIHQRLLTSLVDRFQIGRETAARFTLFSYRQGGRNCLQIVVASPPAGVPETRLYADIDIDLGNPLWDLEGLIVHTGELLDPGKTDHLSLHAKLNKGETKDFLYYDMVTAKEVTA